MKKRRWTLPDRIRHRPRYVTEDCCFAVLVHARRSHRIPQVESKQDSSRSFSEYVSPFSYYPLLRSSTRVVSDLGLDSPYTPGTSVVSSTCTSSVAPGVAIPDLRPLRVAVTLREVGDGEGRRICQFEVPGGGVCADKSCTDLHLNDLEPDGTHFYPI